LYNHETINGNNFEINLTVNYQPKAPIVNISQTINYVDVFEIVNTRMQIATPLLETVVMEIAEQILAQYYLAEEVIIAIKKMQPPITNFNGSVGVSYVLKRNNNKI
jgi:dihydroneopterin aldolase